MAPKASRREYAEPKTRAREQTTDPPAWSMERNISARLAVFEKRLSQLDEKITALSQQFMLSQLRQNEAERDLAHTTIERMEQAIQQIRDQREQLAIQKSKAKDDHERMMIEILDGILLNRLDRTEAERDQALIQKDKAEKGVSQSKRGIKTVQVNTMPGRWDFLKQPPFAGVIQALLLLIVLELIRSGIIPLLAAAFAK